ncbi:MAG: heme-binding protein [Acidisphaera sp.]|nr:heme-binding protein [Acidisphaera sp.]
MTDPSLPIIEAQPVLTLQGCRSALDAAEAQARIMRTPMSIAVVDGAGHLQLFVRMDGVHLGTIDVAIRKARCSVHFRRPTRAFAEALAAGAAALATLPEVVPFAGGVPLLANGVLVGAIGVSGASPDRDEQVAIAGAAAFAQIV